MEGIAHLLFIVCGIVGLILGGVLIDLDHTGTWSCKWKMFMGTGYCGDVKAGPFHNPYVLLSLIMFFGCLTIGLIIHLFADFIRFARP